MDSNRHERDAERGLRSLPRHGRRRGQALKAAAVLGKRDDDLAAAVASLKLDIAAVKADQVLTKGMIGLLLAFNVAIVFKLFSH